MLVRVQTCSIALIAWLSLASSQCPTKNGKSCRFPFVYNGETYRACTTEDNGDKFWCAVSLDANNEVNDYDECSSTCSTVTKPIPSGSCKTTSGVYCQFPFKYLGNAYDKCTSAGYQNIMWCATSVSSTGDVNAFGVCSEDCPKTQTLAPDVCSSIYGDKCIFPFVYSGKTYESCTTVDNNETPWCATMVEPTTKEYITYGECKAVCPVNTSGGGDKKPIVGSGNCTNGKTTLQAKGTRRRR